VNESTKTLVMCLAFFLGIAVAGCGGRIHKEEFLQEGDFHHIYQAPDAVVCEAARQTLLAQGYVLVESPDLRAIDGTKSFQPDDEEHEVLDMHVVCEPSGESTILFANAVQTSYELKRSRDKVGLSASSLGSFTLPWGGGAESLIKVGCETIDSKKFYARFFSLVGNNIERLQGTVEKP
jgi:hypothetical protein